MTAMPQMVALFNGAGGGAAAAVAAIEFASHPGSRGFVIAMLFAAVIGAVSSLDVMRQKPLATLRAE